MIVCSAQRFNVLPPNFARLLQICPSPCEPLTTQAHDEQVRHQAGMPAIAIRERVDLH